MVDLFKSYDRIIISSLCDKLKATYLPWQIVNLIEFMGKNTFVCTSYKICLSNKWKLGNRVRQGGVTSGIFFKFYLNKVLTDLTDLLLGSELSDNWINIFCYVGDIALLPPTEDVLQFYVWYTCSQVRKFIFQNQCWKVL